MKKRQDAFMNQTMRSIPARFFGKVSLFRIFDFGLKVSRNSP